MKKKQIVKRDIYEGYEGDKFESAIQYAITYKEIGGVSEYLSELKAKYQDYSAEIDALVKTENPLLDERFNAWNITEKIKNICKWVCISFLITFLAGAILHADILVIIALLIFFLGGIGAIIFKIVSIALGYKYNNYFKSVMEKESAINAKYINNIFVIRKNVDDLYLESLEPAHREVVLMRRDQERQHQERMRIEQEKLNSQRMMEEEQRKTRQTQEALLSIEREREERYWKNRY